MSKKKRPIAIYVLGFVIAFIIALIVIAVMVMNRVNVISTEAHKIALADPAEAEIDTTIYSGGKYAAVESAIKNYANNYITELEKLESINSDETIQNMLSIENIISDGPEFSVSRSYLEKARQHIETTRDNLIDMAKEENIISAFSSKNLNFLFNWIYKTEMLDTVAPSFFYSDDEINQMADDLTLSLDKKEAVLDFLTLHSAEWTTENNMLNFSSEETLAEYQELLNEL